MGGDETMSLSSYQVHINLAVQSCSVDYNDKNSSVQNCSRLTRTMSVGLHDEVPFCLICIRCNVCTVTIDFGL